MSAPTRHAYTDAEFDDPLFDPGGTAVLDLESTREDRTLAMLTHLSPLVGLGVIAPLVVWLLKRDTSPFVADQAKEALNFHITTLLAIAASVVLMIVLIGIVTVIAVGLGATVLAVVAGIRALDGETYRYPFTLRLI